jgi:hypothetical protein
MVIDDRPTDALGVCEGFDGLEYDVGYCRALADVSHLLKRLAKTYADVWVVGIVSSKESLQGVQPWLRPFCARRRGAGRCIWRGVIWKSRKIATYLVQSGKLVERLGLEDAQVDTALLCRL